MVARAGRRVVVFGGTGYLGQVAVERLSGAGYAVRSVARRPPSGSGRPVAAAAESVSADISRHDEVVRAVEGAWAVVNAVGLYRESGRESFAAVHEAGAQGLAAAAAEAGAERVIQISGIGVDAGSPSPYVRSRALGETRARAGFPRVTILRPSALFGPSSGLLGSLEALTRALPVFPLFGRGAMRLQPVHVGDVAEATLRALEDPGSPGRIYELGGPDAPSYRELVELVLRCHGRRRPLLPVPLGVWRLLARLLAPLPNPPVTLDQLALLARDNVVTPGMPSLADLGVVPRPMAACLPRP